MSIIVYNGVTLPYAHLTDFGHDVIYEDSNTDWFCTRYTISLQTIFNVNYLAPLAGDIVGKTTNPADIMTIVRNRLMKPRKVLSVKTNGVELIPNKQFIIGGNIPNIGDVD